MANQRVSASNESLTSLLKRMFLVVLILMNISGLHVLLIIFNKSLPLPVLEWAGVAALGVAAGLVTRWQLRAHTQTLKLLTAVLALAVNLWLLGWLSSGQVGFRVFKGAALDVNWRGLSQLASGSLLAWISLSAGRVTVHPDKSDKRQKKGSAKSKTKPSASPVQPKQAPEKPKKPGNKRTTADSPALPKTMNPLRAINVGSPNNFQNPLRHIGPAAGRLWKDGISRLQDGFEWVRGRGRLAHLTLRKRFTGKAENPPVRLGNRPLKIQTTNAGRQSSEIRLSAEIEHRCPFCLEIIEENDPRKVKECKICHTRHHADCWDVTGTCQVPHHYE